MSLALTPKVEPFIADESGGLLRLLESRRKGFDDDLCCRFSFSESHTAARFFQLRVRLKGFAIEFDGWRTAQLCGKPLARLLDLLTPYVNSSQAHIKRQQQHRQ